MHLGNTIFFLDDQKIEFQKPKSAEAQSSIENPNEDKNEIQSSNNCSRIDTTKLNSLIQSFISLFVDFITETPLVVVLIFVR